MKNVVFLLLLCILSAISCMQADTGLTDPERNQKTIKLPYLIDLESNLNKPEQVPLSSIGEELEYIPLETTPNSILKGIRQIEFSDSYIFISDFDRLIQFDRKGNFIRQIGSIGKGPGEYIRVTGFCIDEKEEKIFIIAWGTKTILEFDFSGKFIRSFKQSFNSFQFLINDTNSFVFNLVDGTTMTNDSDYKLYITDLSGNTLEKIKNYHKRSGAWGIAIGNTPMYHFDGATRFMQFGVDTLYTLENGKLSPYAIFDLGSMKMNSDPTIPTQNPDREATLNQLKQKQWIENIIENGQYIFSKLDFGLSGSSATCIVNKLTLETTFLQNNSFVNNIDGGIGFWPKYAFHDSILVDYYDSYLLLDHIQKGKSEEKGKLYGEKYNQFIKLSIDLKEYSNPVLIILKSR